MRASGASSPLPALRLGLAAAAAGGIVAQMRISRVPVREAYSDHCSSSIAAAHVVAADRVAVRGLHAASIAVSHSVLISRGTPPV